MTRPRLNRPVNLRLECLEDRAVPATFNVTTTLDVVDPADGRRSLREAITKANTLPGADTIVLPAGVYKIALAGTGEDGNLTGDFDITGPVTIRGAGAGKTFIDGQQLDRVFDVIGTAPSSIRLVLEKLTVRNGRTGHGGGIRVGNADLVVRDCAVVGNRAFLTGGGIFALAGSPTVKLVRATVARNVAGDFGGGIHADTATLTDSTVRRNVASSFDGGGINATTATLTNSTVSGNTAGSSGGGIVAGTANLTNSTVSGNSAGLFGGGISAESANLTRSTVSGNSVGTTGGGISGDTANLTNSSVSGNTAGYDGGGINANSATLTNCTVSGNFAGNDGGGIWANLTATVTLSTVSGNSAGNGRFGGGIRATTATVTLSTVSGNSAVAGSGGGIFADTGTLTNSTISGNTTGTGGGMWANTATLLNCTIAENIAVNGGGLFHNAGGTFSIKNSIVALNLIGFGGTDVSGAFTSQGHNLIGDGAGGTGFTDGVNGDIVGTLVNPIDPKLGPLANNGGKTKTHALLAGSRAIDRGDNAGVPATDQRGQPRRKDGSGDGVATVDIGAFER